MCIDLRGLNKVVIPMVFPMSRADKMFDAVAGASWFSLLDATWGYWQMNVHEKDRDKAAFITQDGLFWPKTIDFGYTNAPPI